MNVAQAMVVGVIRSWWTAALIGGAIDSLAEARVYGVSLYAVGRGVAAKSSEAE